MEENCEKEDRESLIAYHALEQNGGREGSTFLLSSGKLTQVTVQMSGYHWRDGSTDKMFAGQAWRPEFGPQKACERPGLVVHACDPGAGEEEVSQPSLMTKPHGPVRSPVSKATAAQGTNLRWIYRHTCTSVHTPTYTNINVRTHTHTHTTRWNVKSVPTLLVSFRSRHSLFLSFATARLSPVTLSVSQSTAR